MRNTALFVLLLWKRKRKNPVNRQKEKDLPRELMANVALLARPAKQRVVVIESGPEQKKQTHTVLGLQKSKSAKTPLVPTRFLEKNGNVEEANR